MLNDATVPTEYRRAYTSASIGLSGATSSALPAPAPDVKKKPTSVSTPTTGSSRFATIRLTHPSAPSSASVVSPCSLPTTGKSTPALAGATTEDASASRRPTRATTMGNRVWEQEVAALLRLPRNTLRSLPPGVRVLRRRVLLAVHGRHGPHHGAHAQRLPTRTSRASACTSRRRRVEVLTSHRPRSG